MPELFYRAKPLCLIMSFIGEMFILNSSSMRKLEKLHAKSSDEDFPEKLFKFMRKNGEDLSYNYSGSVITDLVYTYLQDEKEIELGKGEMSEFIDTVGEAHGGWLFLFLLLTHSDRDRFIPLLDPSLHSVEDMQRCVEQMYEPYKDMYDGYGAFMMNTLKFINSSLVNLKKDQVLCIYVYS